MRERHGWAWLVLSLAACGDAERPPPLAPPAPPPDEEPSLVDPDQAPQPDLQSPCGAATVALEFVRPNLYFAIDASGSMTASIPAGAATSEPDAFLPPNDRYDALGRAIERLLQRIGHRVSFGARLFPTADVICDDGEEVMPLTAGDAVSFAVSGQTGPVLGELMFAIRRRTPRGGTPTALALGGALQSVRGRNEETYVFLVTDGAPNCNPSAFCGVDSCIPNLEEARLTDEIVCDESINCCDPGILGVENCLDDTGSLAAIEDLARAGVRTFVIGIPGSDAYADVLDRLALAGGVPRAGSPSYYRVNDAEELTATVGALGLEVALACSIELVEPPPDPSLVNVFFDGEVVPYDPSDGWTFVDAQTVQMRGDACALMQTGQVLQADIVAGCPVVIR
jgi:hypothetical protein